MNYKEQILELAKREPTVLALLKSGEMADMPWVTIMEKLVLQLALEKKTLYDMHMRLVEHSNTPAPILLPHGASMIHTSDPSIDEVHMPHLEKGSRISLNDFGVASGNYVVKAMNGDTISLEREK